MYRLAGMVHVAAAFLFVSGLVAPGGAFAQPGTCPVFSADDLDAAFFDWAMAVGFSPELDSVSCSDDPATPETFLQFITAPPLPAFGEVDVTLADGLGFTASCVFATPAAQLDCVGPAQFGLSAPERHICRAEILRSSTWRLFCATSVPAPDDGL